MRIVVASGNPHKAAEFARLLAGAEVVPWDGALPPETGETFRENAELKARHVRAAAAPGDLVLADDSGISVDALGGAPGVRSARFAGEDATDEANLDRLLRALEDEPDRRAAYVAELVALAADGRAWRARGELRGRLARAPRGAGGFGYDPAFVPDGETRTVGEMRPEEKDAISHRARAARALLAALRADGVVPA